MTPEWGFAALFWPQAVRSFAIMLCIVPSVGLALQGFAGAELRYASGLFNLMRNLGGAIGIALVNTWLQDLTRVHVLDLSMAMGQAGALARDVVAGIAQGFSAVTPDPARALLMANAEFARLVGRQALTSAFNDVFRLMSWLFLSALVMVPFCRPPKGPPVAAAEVH